MTERREPEDVWIERVVKLAGALGWNPMRTRWRLIRWQERRRKAARRREQQIEHLRYQHKTCPECGAVQDRDEAVCAGCGAGLIRRGAQVLQRFGAMAPAALSMSTVLAVAILAVYARVWIAGGGGLKSPSSMLLIAFGGHWPPYTADEPWRLVTAVFLHAGLLHLGFNLVALASIGPVVEGLYGRLTMLAMFVITGALANLGSQWMGLAGVGIGASGGIMGLVGVVAGYGQRVGTSNGRALRDRMLKWAGYTIVMGFAVHANNWAHAFGLVLGAAFGYAVRIEVWPRQVLLPVRALAKLVGAVGAVAALVLIFTRTAPPLLPAADERRDPVMAGFRDIYADLVEICRTYYAGDRAAAVAAIRKHSELVTATAEPDLERACDEVYDLRALCAQRAVDADECEVLAPLLARLPERPAASPASSPERR